MADETENQDDETTTEAAEAPEQEAPQAEEAAAPEAAAEEPAAEEPAAEEPAAEEPVAEEPAAQEPAAEEPAAEEPVAEESADAGEGAGDDAPPAAEAEPAEVLSPKEARRRRRSKHTGTVNPTRSPEERHAERVAERAAKASRRRARRLSERAKAAERRQNAPAPEPLPPVHAAVQGTRRVRQGIVVSDKAAKTITVRIDVARRHRRYEKIVRSSSTVHAHDENNDAHEGDVVRVIESRPLSRTKRWTLVDVVERAR
jgi:small subunit ribosomal protein S17